MNFISSRHAKRLVAAVIGALLMSDWAAQAHRAPAPEATSAPAIRSTCPEGSVRICTPHGCYCD